MHTQTTASNNNESIAFKIRQLLKLAEKTTFPEEAASATAKASALMDKYKITLGAVDQIEKENPQIFQDSPLNEDDMNDRRRTRWKSSLALLLSMNHGVYMYTSGPRFICVGTPNNVATVRYLYSYCVKQIDSLTAQLCRGQGRTYANNFRLGCVDAIALALKNEREKTFAEARAEACAKGSTELALVNRSILALQQEQKTAEALAKEKVPGLRKNPTSYIRGNSNARSAGRKAGADIYSGQRGKLTANNKRIG